ncbi:alpha/beta fold hydrolase [Arthrobacter bambusae]|uniref:alpha/beta fold hydrolase n=1 Tax=Arthrobacter bambusae TaxID=1338426 RepID=UPI001F507414|nr:alpha/beta fold hydrolase [Arthrobacter bambusae]MCI0142066.1 alpha/beta fold hydrolase [Arthrobacter bambusae]
MDEADEFFLGSVSPMYVQRRLGGVGPSRSGPAIVLIPGGCHTGMCWTTTPDGRPGWGRLLAVAGRTNYVVDWPGTGRSRRDEGYTTQGAGPTVDVIAQLLGRLDDVVVIAHSIGAPLAAKAIETAPESVRAFVCLAPSAPGNIPQAWPGLPTTQPYKIGADEAARTLANSERFPREYFDEYLSSLCDLSPSVQNACGNVDGSGTLMIRNVARLTAVRSLVIAAEQDALSPTESSIEVADFLQAEFVLLGRDWGLPGFGHMMPIERGSEQILDRISQWIDADTPTGETGSKFG